MLRAFIFGETQPLVSYIEQMCSEVDDLLLYPRVGSILDARELRRILNGYSPELIFVEARSIDALNAMALDIRAVHPQTAIVAFTEDPSLGPFLHVSMGIIPVLRPPFTGEAFKETILAALHASSAGKARLIAFMPAKAGNGASTVALHVALTAAQSGTRILFLDLDLHSGAAAILLGAQGRKSIVDALEESHQLSELNWPDYFTTVAGIDLVAAHPGRPVSRLSRWNYERLLAFVRSRYELVVLDMSDVLTDESEAFVQAATTVFIVWAPDDPSRQLYKVRPNELERYGVPQSKVKSILNRCTPADALEPWACCTAVAATIPLAADPLAYSRIAYWKEKAIDYARWAEVSECCTGLRLPRAEKPPQQHQLKPSLLERIWGGKHKSNVPEQCKACSAH